VRRDGQETQRTAADRSHARSQAAHLAADRPATPKAKPVSGEPDTGSHPGALLKR
jgi:hypothetical protein